MTVGEVSPRRTLSLAARAVMGQGGQGLNLQHMVEALQEDLHLYVFSSGPSPCPGERVPASGLAKLIGRVPLLRRRRDLLTLADDVAFDRCVASRLPDSELFLGVVGQCALALTEARRRKVRTVLDVVNMHVDQLEPHVRREGKRFQLPPFIGPGMRRRILREYESAELIRVMSERARTTFLERGFPKDKVFTATPPVALEHFPVARFQEPRFRIAFVGLLEPWKGVHYLVEAFLKAQLPESELWLWGGSGSRAMTRLLAHAQAQNPHIYVRPVGIRQAGLEEVFGKASVLVHPSLSDGFSYAVSEAMASGLPVVVTDTTGAADLVRDGENGFVVPPGEVDALVERLRWLHSHRERLPQMGAQARTVAGSLTAASFRKSLLDAFARLH